MARQQWLEQMIARLRGLPYVAGVWLVGSLGRGDGDAFSDVDLVVAVDATVLPGEVIADPAAGLGLPGRQLYVRPKPRNAPAGGGYVAVGMEVAGLPLLVDVFVWPAASAAVPAGARALFERRRMPRSELDFIPLLDAHRTPDQQGSDPLAAGTVLMLVQLAAKYLARGNASRLAGICAQLGIPGDTCDVATLRKVLAERIPLSPVTQPAVDAVHRLLEHADLVRHRALADESDGGGRADQRPVVRVGFFGTSIMEHLEAVSAALSRQADLPPPGSTVVVDGWQRRGWPYRLILSLRARYPQLRFEVGNRAAGGATSRDLAAAVEADPVLAGGGYDLVFVGCGINDVWRRYQQRPDEAVGLTEYAHLMEAVIDRLARTCRHVIIVGETPFGPVAEPEVVDAMNTDLATYTKALERLAVRAGARFVGLREPFLQASALLGPAHELWTDGVHMSELGDTLIVQQVERTLAEHAIIENLPCRIAVPKAQR
ncbi:GDSL-type esterase/lipase family protein [Actinoplanes sp. CA-030573]|uniref:GDSL-type esterase/lipase family protein n=1 Tax=Actinoplanes sp. CA-030573 TaxID=3239898 RepID=UPI003D947F14